jgi:predicted type IV restriction endonuclease
VAYLFNFSRKGAAKGRSLREQATELLDLGLWGIGEKTPLRGTLAQGERVLIYLGAPERAFIGHAQLASTTHPWTPEEASRYPGDFEGGVSLSDTSVWEHPVPLAAVLPSLRLRETNPSAHFFAGVIRLSDEDYTHVVNVGAGGRLVSSAAHSGGPQPGVQVTSPVVQESNASPGHRVELLYRAVERLKDYRPAPKSALSEYDTRANFIDRYIEALGYTEIEDVQRGSPVESGNFPDYVLLVGGNKVIAIEAKRLGTSIGPREAAQVVQYCSTLGVRWGAVTDGRYLNVYDAPVLGVPPHERLVIAIDLLDYRDRADFELRIYPQLELLAKSELESGAGLQRRATQEAIREILTTTDSASLESLRRELEAKKNIRLRPGEATELLSELLG